MPVRVSAPPAAQIASLPQLGNGGLSGPPGAGGSPGPPRVSGALSLAQAGAAGQVAGAFWAALGRNDPAAAAQTVPPAQCSEVIDGMRGSPMWGWFTGLAHILAYDVTLCGPGMRLPAGRLAAITVPVLAIGGGLSPPWLPSAAHAVAGAVPGARCVTLDGKDHGVLQQPPGRAGPAGLRPVRPDPRNR